MKKTTIGGQALIEGIIMRGPSKSATVVRKKDGTLDLLVKTNKKRFAFLKKIPIIRGAFALGESLLEGTVALNHSATVSGLEEEPTKFERWLNKKFGRAKVDKLILAVAMIMACGMSVGLFVILPSFIGDFFANYHYMARNVIEGTSRIVIFLIYMYAVSKMDDIKRTFMYHGAEHKSIYCYEKGLELTVDNVREMPKEHPRCGTSFLFVVMIISILVFSVVTSQDMWVRLGLKILLVPVVVGVSYEINRLVGKFDNKFTKMLRYPGLKLQNFTTLEPDDSMIEVAIEALKAVIPENMENDNW